ncbi:MAG: 3-deoxy-7-phosphoheptulonate synthase [Deltaproteobacteria bacterium GWC2_42_11]|nr:MAG: 3-deoxy-7-phosphoheptulonate synthase [Deltaproteobacteria bacterium GWC2_42_11]HBO83758.1 3-deoxy-7-phosphoheptulonate synthase [Deltaproteobacteria bacterium]
MIIVLRPDATKKETDHVIQKIKQLGLAVHISKGKERTIIGAIGDESVFEEHPLDTLPGVEKVMPILKPYKLVSREFQKEDTIINLGKVKIGGKQIQVIAGPCSVETRETLLHIAREIKKAGARLLRGGAFKPRTSPYAFQGLGEEGLKLLSEVKKATGLPVVTELLDPRDTDIVYRHSDIIQIGARNMQNFRLLTEVGKLDKPVLLKRGLAATIKEFLMSAEYIASEGNRKIILCERGIRTFETSVRNTLDLSAIPVLKEETHLPVFIDPSHAVGRWDMVAPLARAAVACGADGLMIEVHSDPENALCDGSQSLKPSKFAALMKELKKVAIAVGRTM